ncbi:MAG: hypothetical protein ACP5RC_10180 [Halothiobacillaceae bacterium]
MSTRNNHSAIHWAVWCLQHTEIPLERILRTARSRFGMPMSHLRRHLQERLGAEFIAARGRRLALVHAPAPRRRQWAEAARTRALLQSAELAGKKHLHAITSMKEAPR